MISSTSSTCENCFIECNSNNNCAFYYWGEDDSSIFINWDDETFCSLQTLPPTPTPVPVPSPSTTQHLCKLQDYNSVVISSTSSTCDSCFIECNSNNNCALYSWGENNSSTFINWNDETFCSTQTPPNTPSPTPIHSPPPSQTTIRASLVVKVLNSDASRQDIINSLCPLLISSIPYTAISSCTPVFDSSIATYYGMSFNSSDVYLIRNFIQRNLQTLTTNANFYCGNTITLGLNSGGAKSIIYRCAPSKITCI